MRMMLAHFDCEFHILKIFFHHESHMKFVSCRQTDRFMSLTMKSVWPLLVDNSPFTSLTVAHVRASSKFSKNYQFTLQ